MSELTAEQVWEMVKDLPISTGDLAYRSIAPWGETSGWHIRGEWMHPHEALALIVDAAKREMGEEWRGCTMVETATLTNWYAVVIVNGAKRVVDAPTESAAVLAAFKAWKEAR